VVVAGVGGTTQLGFHDYTYAAHLASPTLEADSLAVLFRLTLVICAIGAHC
jgi:hypothetical protein